MEGKLCMKQYILIKGQKKYEWYECDLISYINDLKYRNFLENMDSHFLRAKITNFDIIHHECWGDKLQNKKNYERIKKKYFKNYEFDVKTAAVASGIRSERQDVKIERIVMEDSFASNVFFIKKHNKNIKKKKNN